MGCPHSQHGVLFCWHWCLYCFRIVCIRRVLGRFPICFACGGCGYE